MPPDRTVALLTGGGDKPYAFGLATGLIGREVHLDLIGGDDLDSPEFHGNRCVNVLNLRGSQSRVASPIAKVRRVLVYYLRLVRYALTAKPRIFHILWNNKFQTFDRTLLMLFYKCLGKKIALTVHNVNAGLRDANDTAWNRWTLRIQYRLADHLFVHTQKMKHEIVESFGLDGSVVTVIPFGINNAVPDTALTTSEARRRLCIPQHERVFLFFGNIAPYKGLEYLVDAFSRLVERYHDCRLVIAGRPRQGSEPYWRAVGERLQTIDPTKVTQRIEFIPDPDTEVYFKAADVLILPYTHIFQSGVLFLGYRFGLPVIATDVGALREDILEGRTGFICEPASAVDLERAIENFLGSNLVCGGDAQRADIKSYASAHHSWDVVVDLTVGVYDRMLSVQPTPQDQHARI